MGGADREMGMNPEVFEVFREYSLRSAQFGDAARALVKIFDLQQLEAPAFWAGISSDPRRAQMALAEVFPTIIFAQNGLPQIIALVQPEAVRQFELAKATPDSPYANKETLSLLLPEGPEKFSGPLRLSGALESIDLLYAACAEVLELPTSDLIVMACDSGSDKSFDLLGTAKAVEGVKEILLGVWDRVVFYRERQFAQRMELITASLPIIDRIGELEKEKKMGPEQAELIRRKVIDGVSKFLSTGASIPEMEAQSTHSPRVLLAAEPKLLTGLSLGDGSEEESPEASLSSEEAETLKRLLKKSQDGAQAGGNAENGPEDNEE